MKLPSPTTALMVAALAAPITTAIPAPAQADHNTYTLAPPIDIVPSKAITYKIENCGTMQRLKASYLDKMGQTEIGEQYELSPNGDSITTYYTPKADKRNLATSSVVVEFGSGDEGYDSRNACIIGAASLPLEEGQVFQDPSQFDYHLVVYMAPKKNQLFMTEEVPSDEENAKVGTVTKEALTLGNGSYTIKFLELASGTGVVLLQDPKFTSLLGSANYGENMASLDFQKLATAPQPQRGL